MNDTLEIINVARGKAPADLIINNARIVNVFNGEIEQGSIAVKSGRIAGIGEYNNATEMVDAAGQFVLPGLINGHTHVESSMLDIAEYAEAVIPHGTMGVVTDLHEITNVCGLDGIDHILKTARHLPFEFFLMAPSCVPATHLETAGADFDAESIRRLLKLNGVIGLGEMMNYPGILFGDQTVLAKIIAVHGRVVDGHAPGLGGKDLNAYISCGITSDHECIAYAEAYEKLSRGMYIMIREGSSEKNLEALLPLVTDKTYKRCLFVVDDRSCSDILKDGDIDAVVRKAIRLGLEPIRAVQMATINTAEHFGLRNIGAIAPGYMANMIVMPDLTKFIADTVIHRGKVVAQKGKFIFARKKYSGNKVKHTVNVKPFLQDDLRIKTRHSSFPVIEMVPGQIITHKLDIKIHADNDGYVDADIKQDLLKAIVIERHKASGNIGRGLVKGFGLKRGAIASSVAHDSHNIVAVGTNDRDINAAIMEIISMQGGLAVADENRIISRLPLPIAGLMSNRPADEVAANFFDIEDSVRKLGCTLAAPFAALSFIALPVIPELRLTDLGIVDVNAFKLVQA